MGIGVHIHNTRKEMNTLVIYYTTNIQKYLLIGKRNVHHLWQEGHEIKLEYTIKKSTGFGSFPGKWDFGWKCNADINRCNRSTANFGLMLTGRIYGTQKRLSGSHRCSPVKKASPLNNQQVILWAVPLYESWIVITAKPEWDISCLILVHKLWTTEYVVCLDSGLYMYICISWYSCEWSLAKFFESSPASSDINSCGGH